MTLIDTSPMIALLDRGQADHKKCKAAFKTARPFITTWPCMTEAMYFLRELREWGGQNALWALVKKGEIEIHSPHPEEWKRVSELSAVEKDGVVILPLILSPSSFEETENLATFQSVNPPSSPLIGLSKVKQEEYLVRLRKAVLNAIEASEPALPEAEQTRSRQIFKPLLPRNGYFAGQGDDILKRLHLRRFRTPVIVVVTITSILLVLSAYSIRQSGLFPPPLPFNTGWIFVGYLNASTNTFIEGPMARIVLRPSVSVEENIPKLGDILQVEKERRVVIANFKTAGLRDQMTSPPLVKDPIDEDDYTGMTLSKGALLIVRDVEVSGYAGRPVSIWCRAGPRDTDIKQCREAKWRAILQIWK